MILWETYRGERPILKHFMMISLEKKNRFIVNCETKLHNCCSYGKKDSRCVETPRGDSGSLLSQSPLGVSTTINKVVKSIL